MPLPGRADKVTFPFFQLFHEYTHQFTDALLHHAIRMDDGTHDLSENLVILTDYFLIKEINKNLVSEYLLWIAKVFGNPVIAQSESAFLNTFRVPSDVERIMDKEIEKILNHKQG